MKDFVIEVKTKTSTDTRYVHGTGMMFKSINAAERFTKDDALEAIYFNKTSNYEMSVVYAPETEMSKSLGPMEIKLELLELRIELFHK